MFRRASRQGDLDDTHSILRQFKVLVVILLISNIGLGFFGFYFLREIDRKYSNLIGQMVPSLNELQTLTTLSMEAMRCTNPVGFSEGGLGRAESGKRARDAVRRDRDLRSHALEREWLAAKSDERQTLELAGDQFSQEANKVIDLLEAGNETEAVREREQVLRPAFDRYVAVTTRAADVIQAESLRASDSLTARTGSISHMMLGLASWPLMLLGAFLLAVFVFVTVILIKALFSPQEV